MTLCREKKLAPKLTASLAAVLGGGLAAFAKASAPKETTAPW